MLNKRKMAAKKTKKQKPQSTLCSISTNVKIAEAAHLLILFRGAWEHFANVWKFLQCLTLSLNAGSFENFKSDFSTSSHANNI